VLLFILMFIYSILIETVALKINHSIIKKHHDMTEGTYLFNIRYSTFLLFFNFMMFLSFIAFSHFFITFFGLIDFRSITGIILSLFGFVEIITYPFLKIQINDRSIEVKRMFKRSYFTFDEIEKVEVTRFLGIVHVEIFSNEGKLFAVRNLLLGYPLFIDRLKKENIMWVDIYLDEPLDPSDI